MEDSMTFPNSLFKTEKGRNIKTVLHIALTLFIAMMVIGCGEPKNVKKTNYKALLSGTYVYSGAIPGGASATITLDLDRNSRSFTYKETGGISNRSYQGTFAILGNQVVFTNSANKETSKHQVTETGNGFKLKCVANHNPISFGMQPLQGSTLEFYKQ